MYKEQKETICPVEKLDTRLSNDVESLLAGFRSGTIRIEIWITAEDSNRWISLYGKDNALVTITTTKLD